jgi:hypothetical protein
MNRPDLQLTVLLVLMVVYLAMWTYTEVTEYKERDAFVQEVYDFMRDGKLYPTVKGEALEARVGKIENWIEEQEDGAEMAGEDNGNGGH